MLEASRSSRQSTSPEKPGAGGPDDARQEAKGGKGEEAGDEQFVHYRCPTLAHFIALLCRPVASSIPPGTAVVVVDSLSALLNEAFPKATDGRKESKSKKGLFSAPSLFRVPITSSHRRWGTSASRQKARLTRLMLTLIAGSGLSTRRLQTLQYVIGALQKLAATRNCAVVLLSQCATRMQAHSRGAALVPAVNASVWEQGVATRLVLFRDWAWSGGSAADACFAGVQRVAGRKVEGLRQVFAFGVGEVWTLLRVYVFLGDHALVVRCADRTSQAGLFPVEYDDPEQTPTRPVKRKVGDAGLEIADSDDDDYGWDPEDEDHLPPEPPQWQGSEDLIVGTQRSDDEGDAGGEGGDNEGVGEEGINDEGVDAVAAVSSACA